MQLIHLTAKRFSSVTADNAYILNMAKQFNKLLGKNYLLVMANKLPDQLTDMNCLNLNLRTWAKAGIFYFLPAYIYYFFWLPIFILSGKNNSRETVFFSNDSDLLAILIFWKNIFRLKFKICSDWHMLFNNFKDGLVARNSDYLITTSGKLKKLLINKTGVKEEKILTAYGGVDLDGYKGLSRERARISLKLPLDKKLIGYVGLFKTMGMEKGIKTMIQALAYLNQDVNMVFVGARAGQADEYKQAAEKLKVNDRCIFFDMQPAEKISVFEEAMDALVIPYPDKPHFREYGFPMKVYEYMAAKRPIIYSKLELVEEIISDCAFGFKADNAKDLADVITEVVKNYPNAEEKARLAYNKLPNYAWPAKAEKIINFIKS